MPAATAAECALVEVSLDGLSKLVNYMAATAVSRYLCVDGALLDRSAKVVGSNPPKERNAARELSSTRGVLTSHLSYCPADRR
jgi:hypothetical protein